MLLYRSFVYILCCSLVLEPLAAAEIALNQITATNAVQGIHPHPTHGGHYSLRLAPDLWTMSPDQPLLLKDGERLLAILCRKANQQSPLILQVPNDSQKSPHVHLYGSENGTYGPLAIHTPGHLSLYPGTYDALEAEAQHIHLNKNKDSEKDPLCVKKNLLLTAKREILQRAPVTTEGKGYLRSLESIILNNKLSSKKNLFLQAGSLEIKNKGTAFSTATLEVLLDSLKVHGNLTAPLINIVCRKESSWLGSQVHGFGMTVHAEHAEFQGGKFFLKQGLWVHGKTAAGYGEFHIGGKQSWHFPKLSQHTNNLSPFEGNYWNVKSLNLDERTRFQITSGATSIESVFAKIKGDLLSGIYNRDPLSIDVQKAFSLEGITTAFETHLKGMKGVIAGTLTSDKVTASVEQLSIKGDIQSSDLTTVGKSLEIQETARVQTNTLTFDQETIKVAGELSANTAQGRTNHLSVTSTGLVNLGSAQLQSAYTHVDGRLAVGSLDLHGHTFTLSPSGQFSAGSVTNHVPLWSLGGKGSIHSFHTAIPEFQLHGSSTFHMDQATLTADTLRLLGHLNIANLNLSAQSWCLGADAILNGGVQVNVDSAFLDGCITGPSLAGWIQACSLSPTAKVQSSHVELAGDRFKNEGRVDAPSGIHLSYATYPSFGHLSTEGTLGLTLNDRRIDEGLLRYFEKSLSFGTLFLHTNQGLTFTENLFYNRGLALSAPWIHFDGQNPRDRNLFQVDGPLHLEARSCDISAQHYQIAAQSMGFDSADKIKLHNTALISDDHMHLKADKGFTITPEEIHHYTESTRRGGWWTLGKTTKTVHAWNEILPSSLTCLQGPITLESDQGGADLDSVDFLAGAEIFAWMKGPMINYTRSHYDYTLVKKGTFLSFSRGESWQESDVPTAFKALEQIRLISDQAGLHLPGTIFISPEVSLKARDDIFLSLPSLRSKTSYESRGLTFSHSLSGLSKDPLRTLMHLDPVTGSLMSLYDARGNPINMVSAGIMTGIHGYNAYQDLLAAKGDWASCLTDRFLSNLVQVQVGFHDDSHELSQTTPGTGGIYSRVAKLQSDKGTIYTLNGYPLDVGNLTIECPEGNWEKSGFPREFEESSNSFSMGMGFDLMTLTPTGIHASTFSSESKGTQWIPQVIKAQNLTVNARKVITLDGPNTLKESKEGFGFSLGKSGVSANVISGDTSLGVSFMMPGGDQGKLGFFGVQVNGNNFVIPLKGAAPAPQAQNMPVKSAPPSREETMPPVRKEISKEELQPLKNPKKSVSPNPKKSEKPVVVSPVSSPVLEMLQAEPYESKENKRNTAQEVKPQTDPTHVEEAGHLESAWNGVKNTAIGFVTGTINLAQSLGSLAKDTAVLYAAGADEAQMREYALGIEEEQNTIKLKDTPLYQQAVSNMQGRGETLAALGSHIKDGAIVFAGALQKSVISDIAPWMDKEPTPFMKSETFQGSLERVSVPLAQNAQIYQEMTGPQWTEVYAGILASYFLPMSMLKGTQFALFPTKPFSHLKTLVSSRMPVFNLTKNTEYVGFSRGLTWEDLGVKRSPLHFDRQSPGFLNKDFKLPTDGYALYGSVSLVDTGLNKILRVYVASIDAPLKGKSPRLKGLSPLNGSEMIQSLKQLAQISGANELTIRANVVNPRLQRILETRYNGEPWLNQTVMKFLIPKGKADPTLSLLPAPKRISASGTSTLSKPKGLAFDSLEKGNAFDPSRRFAQQSRGSVSLALSPDARNRVAALSGITTVGIGLWAKQQIDHHFFQNDHFTEFSTLFKKQDEKGSRHFSEPQSKGKRSFSYSSHPDPDDDDDDHYIGKDKRKEKKKLEETKNQHKEEEGCIDLQEFDQKMDRDIPSWQNSRTGWYIERDLTRHGGKKYWKLKNPSGKRVLSLDPKGRVIGG